MNIVLAWSVTPDQFGIVLSVFIVLYAVLGGTNNMWGPPIGATIMTLIPEFVRGLESWRPTAFEIVILGLLDSPRRFAGVP